MMIEIIEKIFVATEFNINQENNFASNDNKRMFYVYKNYENIDEFKKRIFEDQDALYDYISSLKNGNEIKKNISFIVMIKLDENDQKKKIQDEILDLEEDKYFFKKYVITYLNEEVLSFYEKLCSYENVIEFMEKNINAVEKFEDFKINDDVSYYSLLLKLYIKIPHLHCKDIFNGKEVISLHESIIGAIKISETSNLIKYYNSIIELSENEIDDYIARLLLKVEECE